MKTGKFFIAILLSLVLILASCAADAGSSTGTSDVPSNQGGPGSGSRPDNPGGGPGGQPGGGPGGSSSSVVYAGAKEITSATTESGQTYASAKSDESALLISTSEAVTITDPTVT